MTDSDDRLENLFANAKKRFEIFVPKPLARINMGQRSGRPDDNGPFGYNGLSLQSGANLFIDCNKSTLFQTGVNYCAQVGGTWTQFSNADMWLSSTAGMNVSADTKITIATPAGQGQITALDHGAPMRLVSYNNLGLHYLVDTVRTGLFEFFHGRQTRDTVKKPKLAAIFGAPQTFASSANRFLLPWPKPAKALSEDDDQLAGGFLKMVARSLKQLENPMSADADIAQADAAAVTKPLKTAKVLTASTLSEIKFGVSGYIQRFDPYEIKPGKNVFALFRRFITALRRYADVAAKYGEALQSIVLVRGAIGLMGAVDRLVQTTFKAYHMATDSYPALITFERAADRSWSSSGWGAGGVSDEWQSGVAGRFKGVEESAKDLGQKKKKKRAKVTSNASPSDGWDVSSRTSWTLTVAWDGGTETFSVLTGDTDEPAQMTLTAPALAAGPEAKTLTIRSGHTDATVALDPSNTASDDRFYAAVGASSIASICTVVLRGGAVVLSGIFRLTSTAGTVTPDPLELRWTWTPGMSGREIITVNGREVSIDLGGSTATTFHTFAETVRTALGDDAEVEEVSGSTLRIVPTTPEVSLTDTAHNHEMARRLSASIDTPAPSLALEPPGLEPHGERDTLVLHIDGNPVEVFLDPARTATGADMVTVLQPAVDLFATVQASGQTVTLTTRSRGGSSRIRLVSFAYAARLQSSPSEDERGRESVGQRLTPAELVRLLGELAGVKASVSDGKVVLVATKEGKGSTVTVSGDLAQLVFGADPTSNTIGAEDEEDAEDLHVTIDRAFRTLVEWNHELQKLPEDTRNLTRPFTEALGDTIATINNLEKALESGAEVIPFASTFLPPPPPKAVGVFADDGITLGTPDRIVGTGGRGIVLIADGGTGAEDRAKFITTEDWVKGLVDIQQHWWDVWTRKKSAPKPERLSLGIRAMSDSAVDLTGTTFAQLAALGRGNVTQARPDGRSKGVGIGIARVLGSYAAEVSAYEKVVISARSAGKPDTPDTAGRVELAADTIAIGAVDGHVDVDDDAAMRIRSTDLSGRPRFGIDPIGIDAKALVGAEHLDDSEGHWSSLVDEHRRLTWSDDARANQPPTRRVDVHANEEIALRSLPFTVRVTKEGIILGIDFAEEEQRLAARENAAQDAVDETTNRIAAVTTTMQHLAPMLAAYSDPVFVAAHGTEAHEAALEASNGYAADLAALQAKLVEQNIALVNAQQDRATALAALQAIPPTESFPRIELRRDAIRLGFTRADGKWVVHNPHNSIAGQPWYHTAAAKNQAFSMYNITSSRILKMRNPTFSMGEGEAVLSNGKGEIVLSDGKATMKFEQGLTATDGSIDVKVQGGTIHLG